jgi:hypothetical protein
VRCATPKLLTAIRAARAKAGFSNFFIVLSPYLQGQKPFWFRASSVSDFSEEKRNATKK